MHVFMHITTYEGKWYLYVKITYTIIVYTSDCGGIKCRQVEILIMLLEGSHGQTRKLLFIYAYPLDILLVYVYHNSNKYKF